MSESYRTIPANARSQPASFTISIPDDTIAEFRQLLKLSKIGPVTYEGLQEDRKHGVTQQWLIDAKA